MQETIHRLQQIQEELLSLVAEAEELVKDAGHNGIYQRAKSYWIAQIETKIHNDHFYLGGTMHSMEDTLQELREEIGEHNDSDSRT